MFRTLQGDPIYDFFGQEYTLLDLGGEGGGRVIEAFAEAGVPLKYLPYSETEVKDLYLGKLTLVRPDQQVAWSGESVDASGARELLDAVTGRHSVSA